MAKKPNTTEADIELHDIYIYDLTIKVNAQEERLGMQERMIEILMEMVNEQRDTIQLIKYAFED
jgi:hypothetical protein